MWALQMMKTKSFCSSKDVVVIQPAEQQHAQQHAQQQQPMRKKRLSEEDPKALQKRVALSDVTNKPQQNVRVTRAQSKKKEVEPESLLCHEGTSSIARSQYLSVSVSSMGLLALDEHAAAQPDITKTQPEKSEWESIPHDDIDATDDNDPQLCKIYVNDIYDYLRESEVRYHASDYMPHQKEINPNMRAILVDWLVEVVEEYKLSTETLYLGVGYLDRYLSKKSVVRSKLQLVGVACMLLASKYEEIYAPSVEEFVYISDNTYSKEEVFLMEANVLDVLEFSLTIATIKNFLRRFLKAACANQMVNMFANYLCEMALHEYCFVKFLPSVVASAAVYLAIRTITPLVPPWTSTLEYYTHHRPTDPVMRACIMELYSMHKSTTKNHFQAVDEKYAGANFLKVSNKKVVPPAVNFHL